MKKYLGLICLLSLLVMLVPLVVLASYNYSIPITIYNSASDARIGIPVLITLNNSQLASLGYINSSGLDTAVQEGASAREYMVSSARLGIIIPSIEGYQSRTYNYRLGESPPQTTFPFMAGSGGYVNISDPAALELGNNFSVEFEGWVDTSPPDYYYPWIAESVEGTSTGISHTVSLPSYEVGELLLVSVSTASPPIHTVGDWPPNGWISLDTTTYDSSAISSTTAMAYKFVTGGETFVFSTNFSANVAYQVYRIGGATADPEYVDSGYSWTSSPDPPGLTPSWGGGIATLWFAGFGGANVTTTQAVSAYPTNYIKEKFTTVGTTSVVHLANARRQYVAASENPGVYTLSGLLRGNAWTVGVKGSIILPRDLIKKTNAFYVNTTGGNITAFLYSSPSKLVTATNISSGRYVVKVWANVTTFGIDIDGVTKGSVALAGATVPNNTNAWLLSIPSFDYYKHSINGTPKAWYEPNTMVLGTTLTDRTGNGSTGAITWGINPSGIEVSIGGMTPYKAYVAPGVGEGVVPDVLPPPGRVDMTPATGATGQGLPLYANFARAAGSLGWTVPVTYVVMFMIIAIVMGFAGLVVTKSIWGFVVGFGGMMGFFGAVQEGGGYYIVPIWLTITSIAFAIFLGYVWRYS